jgi:hypothetical protein
MIRRLRSALRRMFRRPIVVKTYRAEKSDWIRLHFEKHRQLAAELGKPWPERPHAHDR